MYDQDAKLLSETYEKAVIKKEVVEEAFGHIVGNKTKEIKLLDNRFAGLTLIPDRNNPIRWQIMYRNHHGNHPAGYIEMDPRTHVVTFLQVITGGGFSGSMEGVQDLDNDNNRHRVALEILSMILSDAELEVAGEN